MPAAQIATHEVDIATNVLGVDMPDGLPYLSSAAIIHAVESVTCALWQIQTYIYPFFDVGGGWGVHYALQGCARLAVVFGINNRGSGCFRQILLWLGVPLWLILGLDDSPAKSPKN